MGEARFLNEGISFWGPGRAVLSAPSISELSRARKATRPTALIPSVICRNSEARLLGSELGSPTSHLPDLWEVILLLCAFIYKVGMIIMPSLPHQVAVMIK